MELPHWHETIFGILFCPHCDLFSWSLNCWSDIWWWWLSFRPKLHLLDHVDLQKLNWRHFSSWLLFLDWLIWNKSKDEFNHYCMDLDNMVFQPILHPYYHAKLPYRCNFINIWGGYEPTDRLQVSAQSWYEPWMQNYSLNIPKTWGLWLHLVLVSPRGCWWFNR